MHLPSVVPSCSARDASRGPGRRARLRTVAIALCVLALSACSERRAGDAATDAGASDAALPKPTQPSGSITGMAATPGPGEVPITGAPPAPTEVPADQVDLLNPETGVLPGGGETVPVDGTTQSATDVEPGAQDAVAVIRDYYASIDARSYARAYALWSDGGRASRQTPEQFANGYAKTAHVSVEIGTPGDVDAGAGQRNIRVPVAITATQSDGSTRRYDGSFALHRTVVDGATPDQRAWRIASADLRVLQP